ncbi:MAG: hypothetical protein [Bacteriophage sp.]|nr:MAG: hypothetical protein [Bacteriophage sp.]
MTQIEQLLRPSYGWYNSVNLFLDDVQIPMYVARKLIRKARTVCAKCGRCD